MKYVFLSIAVLFNISAYLIFKAISGKQINFFWIGIFSIGLVLGAINTFFFTKSLKELKLGIAYPVFSAASIALVVLISVFVFNEKIAWVNVMGALVIVLGIVLLTW
jgi:multidrug transporter EmrE-like cation transporter